MKYRMTVERKKSFEGPDGYELVTASPIMGTGRDLAGQPQVQIVGVVCVWAPMFAEDAGDGGGSVPPPSPGGGGIFPDGAPPGFAPGIATEDNDETD